MRKRYLFIVIAGICFLPFLDQAFHIDDHGFLAPARLIGWNPLAVPPEHAGVYQSTHTPFHSYLIKMIAAVFGEREPALHAVFLVFPAMVLFAFVRLMREWSHAASHREADFTLLFLSLPPFLVSAHTIMADVPTLAFLLTAVLFFSTAMASGSVPRYYAAGIFLACAVFASYQMAVFIPLFLLYAAAKGRLNRHAAAGALLPAVLLGLWTMLIYAQHAVVPVSPADAAGTGRGIAAEIIRGLRPDVFPGKVISLFALIGASLFFPVLYRFVSVGIGKPALISFLVLTALGTAITGHFTQYSVGETLMLAGLMSLGITAVAGIARTGLADRDSERRPESLLLVAWIAVVLGYNIVLLPFASARYILPALPPLLLLMLREMPEARRGRRRDIMTAVIVSGSVLFGLANAYADYRHADSYRDFSGEVRRFRINHPQITTVWYIGSWGMRYYMERQGFSELPKGSNAPLAGDIIVFPDMPRFYEPSPALASRLKFYASREYRSPLPLRIFNRRSNAGFYAHHWGLLPFAFSRQPDELFQIWEVVR